MAENEELRAKDTVDLSEAFDVTNETLRKDFE